LNEGHQGAVTVGFALHRTGDVSDIRIVKSSLSHLLDAEARGTIRRAAPFPAVPDTIKGEPIAIQVPISFELTRR
jgi:protein TonB